MKAKKNSLSSELGGIELGQIIGKGDRSRIRIAFIQPSKRKIAIKIIEKNSNSSQIRVIKEIRLLKRLDHPNIVKLKSVPKLLILQVQQNDKYYLLFLEYLPWKLENIIQKIKNPFDREMKSKLFLKGALQGLNHIHEKGIAHRDLNISNLLVSQERVAKLINFGKCRDFNGK